MTPAEKAAQACELLRLAREAEKAAQTARDAVVLELLDEGLNLRSVASLTGVSFQRVGQLKLAREAQQAQAWGGSDVLTYSAADHLRHAQEAYRAAKHAQDMRCEEATGAYREEVRAFYGDDRYAQAEAPEQRVRFAGFHQFLRAEERAAS